MIVLILAKFVTKANIYRATQWHGTFSLFIIWQHHAIEMAEYLYFSLSEYKPNNATHEVERMKIDIWDRKKIPITHIQTHTHASLLSCCLAATFISWLTTHYQFRWDFNEEHFHMYTKWGDDLCVVMQVLKANWKPFVCMHEQLSFNICWVNKRILYDVYWNAIHHDTWGFFVHVDRKHMNIKHTHTHTPSQTHELIWLYNPGNIL